MCFRAPSLPLQSAIRPAAARRIISASSELTTPSLFTSAAVVGGELPAAILSAISASAGVIRKSPFKSPVIEGPGVGMS